jgi:hypothetical protein
VVTNKQTALLAAAVYCSDTYRMSEEDTLETAVRFFQWLEDMSIPRSKERW